MRRLVLISLVLTLAMAGQLGAQRLTPVPWHSADPVPVLASRSSPADSPDPLDTSSLISGGVLGGAAGLAAGAIVLSRGCEEFDCLDTAIYAALVGESLGVPLGIHLANGGRGKAGPGLLASLAIGGVGLGAAVLADEPRLLILVPVLQIASAISLERSSTGDDE